MNKAEIVKIQDKIIGQALPHVAFDGWTWEGVERAAVDAGHDAHIAAAVFPERLTGVVDGFAAWVDRQMLARLASVDPENMRIRDRVKAGVLARLDVLQPHKEAERLAVAYWASPMRVARGGRIVWRTADFIWDWAGDEATDYNRYTKRGLLSGILVSTMLAWMNDESSNMDITKAFLDRRIENVMQLNKVIGKVKRAS